MFKQHYRFKKVFFLKIDVKINSLCYSTENLVSSHLHRNSNTYVWNEPMGRFVTQLPK